jgi:hypothetical protein
MFKRRVFTMDPDYFPTPRMREIIDYLHSHGQRYGALHCYHPYKWGANAMFVQFS